MKYIILAIFFFLFTYCNTSGQTISSKCDSLFRYRDNQLVNDWDKAVLKYKLSADNKQMLQKIKQELLDDQVWANSEWVALRGLVAGNLKLASDLFADLLQFNPAIGLATSSLAIGTLTYDEVLQAINVVGGTNSAIEEGLTKTIAKEALSLGNPLAQATKTIWNLYDNVKGLAAQTVDRKELKASITEALAKLENEMTKYESGLNESAQRIVTINTVKEGIDKYCKAPVLLGTKWKLKWDIDKPNSTMYPIEFGANGALQRINPANGKNDGLNNRWSQDNFKVNFSINNGYTNFNGEFESPTSITGSANASSGQSWKWRATKNP